MRWRAESMLLDHILHLRRLLLFFTCLGMTSMLLYQLVDLKSVLFHCIALHYLYIVSKKEIVDQFNVDL